MDEPDPLRLALDQKSHDVPIDEAHFTQIEHDAVATLRVEASAQVWELFGTDSSAHGQRGRSALH